MTPQSRVVSIINRSRASNLCTHAMLADTFLTRLTGLLGSTALPEGSGLLIRPSSGVHTCGMRYAIDVVALDAGDRVLGAWSHMLPWRVCGINFKTRSVLELPSGTIHATQTVPGDQLFIEPVSGETTTTNGSPQTINARCSPEPSWSSLDRRNRQTVRR